MSANHWDSSSCRNTAVLSLNSSRLSYNKARNLPSLLIAVLTIRLYLTFESSSVSFGLVITSTLKEFLCNTVSLILISSELNCLPARSQSSVLGMSKTDNNLVIAASNEIRSFSGMLTSHLSNLRYIPSHNINSAMYAGLSGWGTRLSPIVSANLINTSAKSFNMASSDLVDYTCSTFACTKLASNTTWT